MRLLVEQAVVNKRRSAAVTAMFAAVVAVVALVLGLALGGGPVSVVFAGVVAGALVTAAWWWSARVVLAMSHARPVDGSEEPRLHNVVEGLCAAAGVPKPDVYVVEDEALNAFATGRDARHAAVVVTTGLLAGLSRIELEAVLAHELTHVKNLDILVSTLAATMVGGVALVADWGLRFLWWGGPGHRHDQERAARPGPAAAVAVVALLPLLLAPLAGRLMRVTVDRRREAEADVSGVSLTRYPPGLISALEKLRAGPTVVHSGSPGTAHLWIANPVARRDSEGRLAWLGRLFDTHVPLEERIQALREL